MKLPNTNGHAGCEKGWAAVIGTRPNGTSFVYVQYGYNDKKCSDIILDNYELTRSQRDELSRFMFPDRDEAIRHVQIVSGLYRVQEFFHSMTKGLPSFVEQVLSFRCLGRVAGAEHYIAKILHIGGGTCVYDIMWRGHGQANSYGVSECSGPYLSWSGDRWEVCDVPIPDGIPDAEPEPTYRLAAEVVEDGQLQMEFESRAIGDSEPIEELVI